jgi:hypothetical protein
VACSPRSLKKAEDHVFSTFPSLVDAVHRPVPLEAIIGIVFDVQMARLGIDVQYRLPAALPGTSQRCDVGPPLPAHREIVARQLQQAPQARSISDPHQRRRTPASTAICKHILEQRFGSGQQPRFPPALELDQSREILGGRPRLAQVLLLDQRQRPFDDGPIGRFRPRRDQHVQAVLAIHRQRRGAVKGMLLAIVFVMRDRRGQPAVCFEDAQPVMPAVRHDQMLAVVDQSARLGKAPAFPALGPWDRVAVGTSRLSCLVRPGRAERDSGSPPDG